MRQISQHSELLATLQLLRTYEPPKYTRSKLSAGRTVKVIPLWCSRWFASDVSVQLFVVFPPRFLTSFSMIDWRLVVSLALATALIAACLAYLVAPPWQVQATKPPPSPIPTNVQENRVLNQSSPPTSAEEKVVADFDAAADAILRKAPNTQASTVTDMPLTAARIPLPRRRPADAP